jgi:hypothetical protein
VRGPQARSLTLLAAASPRRFFNLWLTPIFLDLPDALAVAFHLPATLVFNSFLNGRPDIIFFDCVALALGQARTTARGSRGGIAHFRFNPERSQPPDKDESLVLLHKVKAFTRAAEIRLEALSHVSFGSSIFRILTCGLVLRVGTRTDMLLSERTNNHTAMRSLSVWTVR